MPPPPIINGLGWTLGVGQRPKFFFFSEYGHVAYQIKGSDAGSNMVSNNLPVNPPPPDPGVKRSNSTFSEHGHVAYQIKGNRT